MPFLMHCNTRSRIATAYEFTALGARHFMVLRIIILNGVLEVQNVNMAANNALMLANSSTPKLSLPWTVYLYYYYVTARNLFVFLIWITPLDKSLSQNFEWNISWLYAAIITTLIIILIIKCEASHNCQP